jgi:hypothetical protein
MPRKSKPARLYLERRDGREAVWTILDKGRKVRTGFLEDQTEEAEQAFVEYSASKRVSADSGRESADHQHSQSEKQVVAGCKPGVADRACLPVSCAFYCFCRAGARFNLVSGAGVEVAAFAGIWRPWHGERLAGQPGQKRRARELGDWKLYSFLTTEANDVVRPVHEKAMPVILIDPAGQAEWLQGGAETLRLQRPLQSGQLQIRR